MNDFEHGELVSVQACDDSAIATVTDGGYVSVYFYELKSGDLVGGREVTSSESRAGCGDEGVAAGEEVECADPCQLVGAVSESALEVVACEGELAEPLISTCLEDPPQFIEGCEECACAGCYPPLLAADDAGVSLNAFAAMRCVIDRCPDECEAQIDAFDTPN